MAVTLALGGLATAYANTEGPPLAQGSVFLRALVWLALAAGAFVVGTRVDHRWLRTLAPAVYVLDITVLLVTLAVGNGVGDVARWVSVLGFQVQFSEIAKILTIIVLATYLAARRDRLGELRTVVGCAALVVPPLGLVLLQPDLGTSLVFGAILFGTLFLSGARLRWICLLAGGLFAAVPVAWVLVLRDYQRDRILTFLDPRADPQGSGFHVVQAQSVVEYGGLLGTGLGPGSVPGLPVGATDFAFAVFAQRTGFIGGSVVLILFACLLWRILLAGWRSDDRFGLAFAAGLASLVFFQVLVNVGMVLGVMPVTGIPLPFVTHGGASLVSLALGLGILQGAARKGSRR